MSSEIKLDKGQLEARLLAAPIHRWLGLRVLEVSEDGITVAAAWREEFVANVAAGSAHGGILAALIDTVADYALASRLGRPFPTVDLRVDYHRPATQGDLICKGKVIKLGRQVSTAEASVHDAEGTLLASGRGVFLTSGAT